MNEHLGKFDVPRDHKTNLSKADLFVLSVKFVRGLLSYIVFDRNEMTLTHLKLRRE